MTDLRNDALIGERAIMGELTAPLAGGPSGRLIEGQFVEVVLYSGELQSRPLVQVLNGANTGLLRSPDGRWEIFQFLDAEEVGLNRWRLGRLLRGQLGTEAAALDDKSVETPFILLDSGVVSAGLQASELGLELSWRVGAAGKAFRMNSLKRCARAAACVRFVRLVRCISVSCDPSMVT